MSQIWKKVKSGKAIVMVLFVALILLSIPDGTSAQVPNSQIIMSDTIAEMEDHYMPWRMATGNILINGLGLGLLLYNCLLKKNVNA